MAVSTGAALLGSAVIGGALQSRAAGEAASEARTARAAASQQQQAMLEQYDAAAKELEALGIPSIEAQKILLEKPEFAGLQELTQLEPSAMMDIVTDPALGEAQKEALMALQEYGQPGLTEAERQVQRQALRSAAGQEQARQAQIQQSMAQRGIGGSGIELAQQLASSQAQAERSSMAQAQLAASAQQRALQALTQGGQLAGQIRGQEFGEQAQVASAADRIAQFNAQMRAQTEAANLARQQEQFDKAAAISRAQETSNKSLIQQQFQNELAKRQAVAAARTGQAQARGVQAGQTLQAGQAAAAGQVARGAAQSQLIGQLAGAYTQYGSQPSQKVTTQVQPVAPGGSQFGSTAQPFANGGIVPDQVAPMVQPLAAPNSNAGFAYGGLVKKKDKYYDGGLAYEDGGMVRSEYDDTPLPNNDVDYNMAHQHARQGYAEGGMPYQEGGEVYDSNIDPEVVPVRDGELAGDRVDARLNEGEMILNAEQQQRLMELLKGIRQPEDLGSEDIIIPAVPLEAQAIGQVPGQAPLPPVPPVPGQAPIQPVPQFADGGITYSDTVKDSHDKLAESLVGEYDKATSHQEEMKSAQKEHNAKVKALETLMGIDKKKENNG